MTVVTDTAVASMTLVLSFILLSLQREPTYFGGAGTFGGPAKQDVHAANRAISKPKKSHVNASIPNWILEAMYQIGSNCFAANSPHAGTFDWRTF
jgi:hypothetical protein